MVSSASTTRHAGPSQPRSVARVRTNDSSSGRLWPFTQPVTVLGFTPTACAKPCWLRPACPNQVCMAAAKTVGGIGAAARAAAGNFCVLVVNFWIPSDGFLTLVGQTAR